MRLLQRGANLLTQGHDFFPCEAPTPFQQHLQGLAVDELHYVERSVAQAPGAKQPDNVRVAELLENRRLALEAGQRVRRDVGARDDLDSDRLAGLVVTRPIHRSHRARADLLLNQERPNLLTGSHGDFSWPQYLGRDDAPRRDRIAYESQLAASRA